MLVRTAGKESQTNKKNVTVATLLFENQKKKKKKKTKESV